MTKDKYDVEAIKAKYESDLIVIEGVEAISIGIGEDGKKCLLIGLSAPERSVKSKLPPEIFSVPVEFVYVGNIDAQ